MIPEEGWRKQVYRIIYYSDTPAGKLFDIILLGAIVLSAVLIIMESLPGNYSKHFNAFYISEWILTIFFTLEYMLRLLCIKNNRAYVLSTLGIIDLLALLPFYLSLVFPGAHFLMIIRLLRLLRVFRIFRLMAYLKDAAYILNALRNSYRKIFIFLFFISVISVVVGALMYVIEDGRNGFHSIPESIYWAIVTITTVGYGDISPGTAIGKFFAVILMLCGYSIIAVPTGIVGQEFKKIKKGAKDCDRCGNQDNDADARYCKVCGEKIQQEA
ncbi:ion transporter [Taibaiella sp. KBW10]|nr:ion transporter [Taibaiella sp. KBW10]